MSSMRPIPVLMYHHTNHHKGDMVTITPKVFEGQMEYLHKAGYRTLKIGELISYINGELTLTQKAVVVTFDDGWLDNYMYAFPILKKYKINATVFLITNRVENASLKNSKFKIQNSKLLIPTHNESKILIEKGEAHKVVINWELIKEMSNSGLIEFYSHTKSHAKCNSLSEKELMEELKESREIIEKQLGSPGPYFCWPYGKYNGLAVNVAKKTGYKALFTTNHGVVEAGSDPFAINRIIVKDSVAWFKKRMVVYTNTILSKLYLKIKKK
ncbi:MAG: polysaccharide deacetylase family protein [Nitrospirae bacterium]|nr:polysaccharide deacetylase family protein [Nitrospirota bacterium]MBI3378887.1 polysaccharide deacetylase family protein [Nitrospirota bacterium]